MFLLISGALLIAFLREFYKYSIRLHEIRKEASTQLEASERDESSNGEQPQVAPRRPQDVASSNFRILESYYGQHLVEYKLMSRATLAIALLGFVVVIIGVFLALKGTTSVGIVTGLAGTISEAAAVLFFQQNKITIEQIRDYHKKLVSTQYLMLATSLTSSLPPEAAQMEVRKIIGNLLYLSNELHGAGSSHLFSMDEEPKADVSTLDEERNRTTLRSTGR